MDWLAELNSWVSVCGGGIHQTVSAAADWMFKFLSGLTGSVAYLNIIRSMPHGLFCVYTKTAGINHDLNNITYWISEMFINGAETSKNIFISFEQALKYCNLFLKKARAEGSEENLAVTMSRITRFNISADNLEVICAEIQKIIKIYEQNNLPPHDFIYAAAYTVGSINILI